MSTRESMLTSLFNDYGSKVLERFENSSEHQKQKVVQQLEQIAKHQEPAPLYRPVTHVLDDIKQAMEDSDRARVFFAYSFVSWYRSNAKIESKLGLYSELDISNRRLYAEMLGLRDMGVFSDEELYQFEQYCLTFVSGE